MIKKCLALIFAIALSCAVSCATVFAYNSELVDGCPTAVGTKYADASHTDKITYNNPADDYTGVPFVGDNTAKSMTITYTAQSGGNNFNPGGGIDISSVSWENTGTIEVTYEATLVSPSDNEIRIGLVPRVMTSGGKNMHVSEDGLVDKLIDQCSFYNAAAGTKIYAKSVYRFTSTAVYVDIYSKTSATGDYEYKNTATCTETFSKEKYEFVSIAPYGRTWYSSADKNNVAKIAISNIAITETYSDAMLDDVSGNYLSMAGEPSKEVNYCIPSGFVTANLTLNGTTLASFSASDGDVAGSYKTTIDFSKFDVGDNIPLVLTVNMPESKTLTKTVKVNINAPISDASMTNISGRYPHTETLTASYEIPHTYDSANLKFNGVTIAEYDKTTKPGGKYSTSIVLADYENLGDDVPVTLTVTVDGEDTVITYYVDVYYYYADAELEDVSGYYTSDDSITFSYTIPTEFSTASLKLDDTVLKTFGATDNGGEYKYTLDLSKIDFDGKTYNDFNLVLNVNGSEISRELTVYNIVSDIKHMSENFDGSDLKSINTLSNGELDTTSFDTNVYKYYFNDDSKTINSEMRAANSFAISEDWFLDITCDFYVENPNMQVGISLRDRNGSQYAGTPKFMMATGKFMDSDDHTYTSGKWYTLKHRIIPRQYSADGKGKICLYVDGKYVGSEDCTADRGYQMLGLYFRNGGASIGWIYVDNVVMTGYAPCYTATPVAVDVSGNEIGAVDCDNPILALKFNQKMNSKTINEDNIKLTSFNGTKLDFEVTYDEEKSIARIEPSESLVAGSKYFVSLSENVKSGVGGGYSSAKEYAFSTASQPVSIDSITAPNLSSLSANADFTVTVTVNNNSGSNATGYIYAVYFCGNQLQSISSTPVSGATSTLTYSMPLKTLNAVDGERKVAVYYVSGLKNFSVIDTVETK